MPQPHIISDKPIIRVEQDELDILPFVRRLVRPLLEWPAEDSLVLGLYGPWGSGKSSVLNLLASELNQWEGVKNLRAIPVRFNPWHYSSEDALLVSFFGTLASATGTSKLLTKSARKHLAKALKAIGQSLPILTAVTGLTALGPLAKAGFDSAVTLLEGGESRLENEKKKAEEVLLEIGRGDVRLRVVVLVDDLDRAADTELRAMLRLVKLIADLPNISYILAMDDGRVREVLSAGRTESFGQSFLDKIVQIPVQLPPLPEDRLEILTKKAVAEVLQEAGYSADGLFSDERHRELDPYPGTLGKRITSLRDRARLMNNLRFMLLAGPPMDVSPIDAVLVSFLQTFYPDVYRRLPENKSFLTGQLSSAEEIALLASAKADQAEERRRRTFFEIASGNADPNDKQATEAALSRSGMSGRDAKAVEDVLKFLFPRALQGEEIADEQGRQLRAANRIQHPDRFDRYFRLYTGPGEVPDRFVDELLAGLVAAAPDASVFRRLDELQSPGQRDSFVEKFKDRLDRIPSARASAVADAVLSAQERFSPDDVPVMMHQLAVRAFMGAARRTEASSAREPSAAAAAIVLKEIKQLPNAYQVVSIAKEYVTDRAPGIALDHEAKKDIAQAGLARANRYAGEGRNLFADYGGSEGMSFIWRWRDLTEFVEENTEQLRRYLRELLERDPVNLLALLRGMSASPRAGRLLFAVGSPKPDVLKAVEQIIGVQALREICEAHLDKISEEKDPDGLVKQCIDYLSDVGPEMAR